jgi:dolichol-phosphate mannosyltransferase
MTTPENHDRTLFGHLGRFLIVGGSGTVVNMAIFVACTDLVAVNYLVASVLAFLCAVTWNYYWNRRWTFRAAGQPGAARQYVRFVAASVASLGINLAVLYGLVRWGLNAKLGQLGGIAAGTLSNFVANRCWVFASRRHSRSRPVAPQRRDAPAGGAFSNGEPL